MLQVLKCKSWCSMFTCKRAPCPVVLQTRKNWLRVWEKQAPFVKKKPSPCLGKTGSVFGTNWLRFWGKPGSVFGKNWLGFWEKLAWFLGKTGSVLGKNWLGLGENWLGFGIGLGQSSSLTVLNAKHVWVWVFEVLGLGVSKKGYSDWNNLECFKIMYISSISCKLLQDPWILMVRDSGVILERLIQHNGKIQLPFSTFFFLTGC